MLNRVLDAGINLIDTAIDYGEAEAQIGRHIAHRRDDYFLATKAGCALDPAAHDPTERTIFGVVLEHDYSRENIVAGIEQSLRRDGADLDRALVVRVAAGDVAYHAQLGA